MPNDDVVGFDVLVDDVDNFVAVVHRLKHVNEEIASLPELDALRDHQIVPAIFAALGVVFLILCIQAFDHIAETAIRIIVGDDVDVAALGRIVDDLVQPDQVCVLQLLQQFKLLEDGIVCGAARVAKFSPHEHTFVHRFDSVEVLRSDVLAKADLRKCAGTKLLFELVVVDLVLTLLALQSRR